MSGASDKGSLVGERVRVYGGRQHVGREGVVRKHIVSRYNPAPQAELFGELGRAGYVVLVQDDDGDTFWVGADAVLPINRTLKGV